MMNYLKAVFENYDYRDKCVRDRNEMSKDLDFKLTGTNSRNLCL